MVLSSLFAYVISTEPTMGAALLRTRVVVRRITGALKFIFQISGILHTATNPINERWDCGDLEAEVW